MSESESTASEEEHHSIYGSICDILIVGYFKYTFTLKVTTNTHILLMETGGGHGEEIYRYDPMDRQWCNHPYKHIIKVEDLIE